MAPPRFANYDLEYSWKDYATEAIRVTHLIRARNPDASSLLDVACGTGRHLEHLQTEFPDALGLDLSKELLDIARTRLPHVPFIQGDMTDFHLGREFDAVTCLFSSVGYLEGVEPLRQAMASMAAHLRPGGVLIVEPWLSPDIYDPSYLHSLYVKDENTHLARMAHSWLDGRTSVMHFVYQWLDATGVHRADLEHRLFLFTQEAYLQAIQAAGLQAEWVDEGLMPRRGLALGIKAT